MAKTKLRDSRVARIHDVIAKTAADPSMRNRTVKQTAVSPEARTARGIIVLGMHRTGTSAVTNILMSLGFEIPGEPVPANVDNPRGYWEPREIVEIHDEFLHHIGRSWSDPRPLDRSLFESAGAVATTERLRELMRRLTVPGKQWIIKDPRMCRLMPLWHKLLAQDKLDFRFLHVLRSPLAVAGSLRKRDRFSREKSLLLWLRYNLEAEAATRGQDRSWLNFEEVTAAPATHVLRGFRSATGSPRLAKSRIEKAIEGILEPSLVHHAHGLDETLERLAAYPWVAITYRALSSLGTDDEAASQVALDEVRTAIGQADGLFFGDPGHWEAELAGERFHWLKQSVDSQRREIKTQRAEVDALRDSFNAERERHEKLLQELEMHRHSMEKHHQEGAASQKTAEGQRETIEALQKSLNGLIQDRDKLDEQFQKVLDALDESMNGRIEHRVTERLRVGNAELLRLLEAQHGKLDVLGESAGRVERHEIAAEEQRREIVESLRAVKGQGQQLEALSQGISAIEDLLTERFENRHLTLLSKSLETTARVESEWMSARSQLAEMAAERDTLIRERDGAIRERDAAIREQDAAAQVCARLAGERDELIVSRQQAVAGFSLMQGQLEQISHERDLAQAEIAQILQRVSWRITAPLRTIFALLKGRRS